MDIIEPITITDAVLVGSNVPEVAVAEFSAGVTYALGAQAGVTSGTVQAIYRSNAAGNVGHAPAASPTWWKLIGTVYVQYSATASYDLGAVVSNVGPGVHDIFESLVSVNHANALTDITKWAPRGRTNRWSMFDGVNSTYTENPDSVEVSMRSSTLCGGLFIGDVDGTSWSVTVTDAVDGVVYSKSGSLVASNSGASFFNWCFKRIFRKTALALTDLPMYLSATIKVTINNPGAIARCGTGVVGPITNVGPGLAEASADIKDYSSETFNSDGSSETVERGYAKRMTMDVLMDNDEIDSIHSALSRFRQMKVVWVGSARRETLLVFGKFGSFKTVIKGALRSVISFQINGSI